MLFRTALLVLVQAALSYKPVVLNAYYAVTTVKEYRAASFKMDFNDTIYLRTASGTLVRVSDPSMFAAAPVPFASSSSPSSPPNSNSNSNQQQQQQGCGAQANSTASPSASATGTPPNCNTNSGNGNGGGSNGNGNVGSGNGGGSNGNGGGGNGGGNGNGGGGNSGDKGGGGPSILPNATILFQGLFNVTCTGGYKVPSVFGSSFSPEDPSFPYMAGPPSSDPTATVLNVATGGLNLFPAVFPNRASFFIILGTSDKIQKFSDPNFVCTVSKNTSSPLSLVNANGEEVQYPIRISQSPPQCTYEGARDVAKTITEISAYGLQMTSADQIRQLSNAMDVLKAMESFAGCDSYIQQFLNMTSTQLTLKNSVQCPFRHEDPQWQSSPCCNHAIIDQCCAPSTRFLNAFLVSVKPDIISQTCQSPGPVSAVLNLAATANNYAALKAPYDPQETFTSYMSFFKTCRETVFNKQCKSDSDCIYSGSCGRNNYCSVDWNNPAPPLFACYVANMKADLLTQVELQLDLPTTYSSSAAEGLAVASAILPQVSSSSCIGQTGYLYNGQYSYSQDENGNFVATFKEGNQTLCVKDNQCTYEFWARSTITDCLADKAPGYCAICDDFWCNPISSPRECMIDIPREVSLSDSQTLCSNSSGRLVTQNGQTNCYLDSLNTNITSCLSFNNASSCVIGQNDDSRCSRGYCKGPETNSSTCQASNTFNQNGRFNIYWSQFDSGAACVYGKYDYGRCTNAGNTWVPGVKFEAGIFATNATCPGNYCADDLPNNQDRANQTICQSNFQCSLPACTTCVSYSFYGGACFNTSITAASSCDRNAEWFKSWEVDPTNPSTGICQYINYRDSSSCKAANLTFYNAADAGLDATKCSAYPSAFRASMLSRQKCPDQSSCEAAGQCDDYEYQRFDTTTFQPLDGVCLYTPSSRGNCGSNQGTRLGKCINSTISSSAACGQLGLTWQTRAKTESQCKALGSYCSSARGWSTVNSTQCLSCGGTPQSIYTWNAPQWKPSKWAKTSWKPVNWASVNTWGSSLDFGKLENFFNDAVATLVVLEIINDFNSQYSLLATVYQAVACDCIAGRTDCFASAIETPLGSCTSDVLQTSSCQGLQISKGTFNGSTPVSTTAKSYNAANMVTSTDATPSSPKSKKRAIPKTSKVANYAVVKNKAGILIGQIIGNGISYSLSKSASSNVTICLDIDSSISQSAAYTIYDISEVSSSGVVSCPYYTNTTISGTSVCGSVPAFQNATFVPVLRNSVGGSALIESTSTSTSTSTSNSTSTSTLNSTVVVTSTTTPRISGAISSKGVAVGAIVGVFFVFLLA